MYDDPVHVAFIRTSQWMHAVELQLQRVLQPVDRGPITPDTPSPRVRQHRLQWNERQRDIDFFVIALNRLRIAAVDARRRLGDKGLRVAVRKFDAAVPDLKDLRDIAEHFERYDWGLGKLVRRGQLSNESPSYSWGEHDADLRYRGKMIRLVAATQAARALHRSVMTVLADRGRAIDLSEWPLIDQP